MRRAEMMRGAGKRELSQSKIPPLTARLAQLPMGLYPLSSTDNLPFTLFKFPGGSTSSHAGSRTSWVLKG